MLLAGDIGGTKTLLGLYNQQGTLPHEHYVRRFSTLKFHSLTEIVEEFLQTANWTKQIDAAWFGVAGPVQGQVSQLTNIPWLIDATDVGYRFSISPVRLLNDLTALAHAIPVLTSNHLSFIRSGQPDVNGNIAVIAPGTGLGQALLHNINNRYIPTPSEGGHADFAARTERELEFVQATVPRLGRISYEQVISGPGLVNLHQFVHGYRHCSAFTADTPATDQPALISKSALEKRCPGCEETLDLFVGALGAEAGNLGLRSVATGGVFLGGGIPAKILPALHTETFVRAFLAKSPMNALVDKMPVAVILKSYASLLGAAIAADELSRDVAETSANAT